MVRWPAIYIACGTAVRVTTCFTGARSLVEVRNRGRWQSSTSLRKYGKDTRSFSEAAKLNPALVDYARSVLSGDFRPGIRFPKFCQPQKGLAKNIPRKRPAASVASFIF